MLRRFRQDCSPVSGRARHVQEALPGTADKGSGSGVVCGLGDVTSGHSRSPTPSLRLAHRLHGDPLTNTCKAANMLLPRRMGNILKIIAEELISLGIFTLGNRCRDGVEDQGRTSELCLYDST